MTMYSVPIERLRKTPSRKHRVSKNFKPKIWLQNKELKWHEFETGFFFLGGGQCGMRMKPYLQGKNLFLQCRWDSAQSAAVLKEMFLPENRQKRNTWEKRVTIGGQTTKQIIMDNNTFINVEWRNLFCTFASPVTNPLFVRSNFHHGVT